MQSCLKQGTLAVLRVTPTGIMTAHQSVPMFLPIMRGTLNLPAVRDPEVLERLDPNGLLSLCLRYQQHIALCSEVVASEQVQLGHKVRDVSGSDLMSHYLES
jgi:glutamine phosphoribosylpyrophosphate amidotransferase